jgi:hypothetical protein
VFDEEADMNERQNNQDRLAAWADETLKQLPARPAPSTLAPRVFALIARQAAAPWYRRPWMSWPRHFQILSVLVFSGVMAAVYAVLLPQLDAVSPTVNPDQWTQPVSTTVNLLGTLGNAAVAVLRSTQGWVLATVLGVIAMLYFGCIGLGAACWRIVSNSR